MAHKLTAAALKPCLIRCGYKHSLLKTGARYAGRPDVALIAFAHEPTDARSACIAALNVEIDPVPAVAECFLLGAPVVLACHRDRVQVFKHAVPTPQRVGDPMAPDKLDQFFDRHSAELDPHEIYRLKTRGLLKPPKPQQLKFVDVGLMRLVDEDIGRELTRLVERIVDRLVSTFGRVAPTEAQGTWILKWAFRLLAGKILKDKEVDAFQGLDLLAYERVAELVGKHYARGGNGLPVGTIAQRGALQEAARLVGGYAHLGRVTTEALADVYESALVSRETRKALGTHSTPSYLADYMVWQLADWIEKIPLDDLWVFEPACGHSAFLVSVMRFIREAHPALQTARRSRLYRERFSGIELDRFALEIAKLSLTLADVPNPDGWEQVVHGNMFANRCAPLRRGAEQCTLLLANPPFEEAKAFRVLKETIPHLRPGAVFGFVVPQAIIYSPKRSVSEFRKWLLRNCQISEVCAFPQGMFKFSDHESGLLLGRRIDRRVGGLTRATFRAVRDKDKERFKERYGTTTRYDVAHVRFLEAEHCSLWIPDLDEVWQACNSMRKLGSIAEIGKGLDHRSKKSGLPEGTIPTSKRKPEGAGFRRGFKSTLRHDGQVVRIHELPDLYYLNLNKGAIATARAGATPRPQVLLNYGRVTRVGTWRLVAYLDGRGHPFTSRFLSVRPKAQNCPLEYLWALCNSPVANAFAFCHTMKRDNTQAIISRIAIPRASDQDVERVVRAAKEYLNAAPSFDETRDARAPELPFDQPSEPVIDAATLRRLLLAVDAEVLRLYALPAWAERRLLDRFADSRRKGVPFDFGPYYPAEFKHNVPLYAYLSETYQRYLRTGDPEVSENVRRRYDELIDKRLAGELTPAEDDELHRLEAEMDGSDYAAQPLDDSWREAREADRREAGKRLDSIANRIVDLTQTGGPANANRS